jgi:hypothetical protein
MATEPVDGTGFAKARHSRVDAADARATHT